jgi:hypothetical protein
LSKRGGRDVLPGGWILKDNITIADGLFFVNGGKDTGEEGYQCGHGAPIESLKKVQIFVENHKCSANQNTNDN